MVEQWYYENVQYVIVKNQDLLKNKKQKGMLSDLGVRTPLSKVPILDDNFNVYTKLYIKWMK